MQFLTMTYVRDPASDVHVIVPGLTDVGVFCGYEQC